MSLWQNANKMLCMDVCHHMNSPSLCWAECYTLNWGKILSCLAFFFFFFFFFKGVNLLYLCLRCGTENLNVQRKRMERRNISQGCRRESGSSRRSVMFWPQCKSISAILLMNWSMIYTVSGARFLPPPLTKCWQRLSVFARPFVLLWVSWFVLFILNSWSSLAVSW